MTSLVVGNLDCELAWAAGAGGEVAPLPRHVAAKLAAAATLLRAVVVAGADAAVWAPGPVEPERLPEVAGGPRWQLVTGPLDPTLAATAIPWGATSAVPPRAGAELDPTRPWRSLLAELAPAVTAARAASDRRFAHALAGRLGCALSGARTVTSIDELVAHLAAGGADASPSRSWVVKAPLTAAGRDRVRRRGTELDAATAQRISRLLQHSGALVFEPWLDRVQDLGQPGLVLGPDRSLVLPPHILHSDPTGGFAGITIVAAHDPAIALDHRDHLATITAAVATELAALGYRGPFTVDAFVHRDPTGDHLHPLVEINPRLTFGLVARAWSERLAAPLTLRLAESAPPPGAIVLLAPGASDPTAAWLELH